VEPITEAVLVRVRRSLEDLRNAVRGLPAIALNWRPAEGTNSIASQVAHVLKSADFMLRGASGADADLKAYLAERDEPFHFGADANALLEMLDEFEANLAGRLRSVDAARLGTALAWPEWNSPTVASCLIGVAEHMREHVGAASLTRQMWEAGPGLRE
jgi:hypothetical protein